MTWEVGTRVCVKLANPGAWTTDAALAVNGKVGEVTEIVPNYSFPVALGGKVPKPGFFVKLDEPVVWVDGFRPSAGVWCDAEDLIREE